jgi:hypothetical protein
VLQVVAVNRDADKRVLKLLVEWPEDEGFEMKSTASGERCVTNVDVLVYLEGITSPVNLRKLIAMKSTESGTFASIKRALAVGSCVRVRVCACV